MPSREPARCRTAPRGSVLGVTLVLGLLGVTNASAMSDIPQLPSAGGESSFAPPTGSQAGFASESGSAASETGAPIANPDELFATIPDGGKRAVLTNDRDPEGGRLRLVSWTAGAHGTVQCDAGGRCTYMPSTEFSVDEFSYVVSDAEGDESTGTVTVTRAVDDDDERLMFSPDWWAHPQVNHVGPEEMQTAAGGWMEVVFTGDRVRWLGARRQNRAIAEVLVDGASMGRVDTYYPETQGGVVLWEGSGFGPGEHILRIVHTGTANPSVTARTPIISVDAFADATLVALPRLDGTHPGVAYSTGWRSVSNPATMGGAERAATGRDQALAFCFIGSTVSVISTTSPDGGIGGVTIDGEPAGTFDTYDDTTEHQREVYRASGLHSGSHAITITHTGTANAASAGRRLAIDALGALELLPVARVEEQGASGVTFEGGWRSTAAFNRSGGTESVSTSMDGSVQVVFDGVAAHWIASRGPNRGIARVSVDGIDLGTIDLYATTTIAQAPVLAVAGLSEGSHTLTIRHAGVRNPAAVHSFGVLAFDALDVAPSP